MAGDLEAANDEENMPLRRRFDGVREKRHDGRNRSDGEHDKNVRAPHLARSFQAHKIEQGEGWQNGEHFGPERRPRRWFGRNLGKPFGAATFGFAQAPD